MENEEEITQIFRGKKDPKLEETAEGANQERLRKLNMKDFEVEALQNPKCYRRTLKFENPIFNREGSLYNKLVPGFTTDAAVYNLITITIDMITIQSILEEKINLAIMHRFTSEEKNNSVLTETTVKNKKKFQVF